MVTPSSRQTRPASDWLGALTDGTVAERHRRYVGSFEFEHPELFAEYLSVSHPDFILLQQAFFREEESIRRARRPPAVSNIVRYQPPPSVRLWSTTMRTRVRVE